MKIFTRIHHVNHV